MKIILTTISFIALAFPSIGQEKLRSKDIVGEWRLVIDLREGFEEAEEDREEGDNFLGKLMLGAISGMVTGILEEIEIQLDFQSNGVLKITVDAFDSHEEEYAKWSLSNGRLTISDNETYDDEDGYWMKKGDKLINIQSGGRPNGIYMIRIP